MEKRFHFQELNWSITVPNSENCGKKYPDYSILISNLKDHVSPRKVRLLDIVESLEFQERLPHTVGFYKCETGESSYEGIEYLELRIIRSVEDFWKFLNDLDL